MNCGVKHSLNDCNYPRQKLCVALNTLIHQKYFRSEKRMTAFIWEERERERGQRSGKEKSVKKKFVCFVLFWTLQTYNSDNEAEAMDVDSRPKSEEVEDEEDKALQEFLNSEFPDIDQQERKKVEAMEVDVDSDNDDTNAGNAMEEKENRRTQGNRIDNPNGQTQNAGGVPESLMHVEEIRHYITPLRLFRHSKAFRFNGNGTRENYYNKFKRRDKEGSWQKQNRGQYSHWGRYNYSKYDQ
ncbi:hypothetical protein RFI_08205, partial [Reticulomyxa filosa]